MNATIARSLTAIALTGAAVVGVAAPAMAQGTRPCPSAYYCFYQHAGYNGWDGQGYTHDGWKLQYQSTTFGDFSHPPYKSTLYALNSLSSIINNTSKRICVYDAVGGTPKVIVEVKPYQDYSYVGDSANDKADYWKVVSGSSPCPST